MSARIILVALDSFKECASSADVSSWVAQGLRMALPGSVEVKTLEVSDGGRGFEEVIAAAAISASLCAARALDPSFDVLRDTTYSLATSSFGQKIAVIESAKSIGLGVLTEEGKSKSVLDRSSFGLGQVILEAASEAPDEILIGTGDSAVQDCGIGVLAALGAVFVLQDRSRVSGLEATPRKLLKLNSIDISQLRALPPIRLACNLSSVLEGSSATVEKYAKQKGATSPEIRQLTSWTKKVGKCYANIAGTNVARYPGSGASGGVGAALIAAFGATPEYSFNVSNRWISAESEIKGAALVVVGEGRLDEGTAKGKAPGAISMMASAQGIPVVAVAGSVAPEAFGSLTSIGISAIQTLSTPSQQLSDYMDPAKARQLLREAGIRLAPVISVILDSQAASNPRKKRKRSALRGYCKFVVACDLWQTVITRRWKYNFVEAFRHTLDDAGLNVSHSIVQQALNVSMLRHEMDSQEFAKRLIDLVTEDTGISETQYAVISEQLRELSARQVDESKWIPGAENFLESLRMRGGRIVAVSNSERHVQAVLDKLKIREYFDEVVLSYQCGVVKPNPALFLRSSWFRKAKQEGIPAFVVGDQFEKDILAAQILGVESIHLRHKERPSPALWYACTPAIGVSNDFSGALELIEQRLGA